MQNIRQIPHRRRCKIKFDFIAQKYYKGAPLMHVFYVLLATGGGLIVIGLCALIYVIPKWTPKNDLKTEFFATRGALWCIAIGLAIIFIGAIEACIKDVILRRSW